MVAICCHFCCCFLLYLPTHRTCLSMGRFLLLLVLLGSIQLSRASLRTDGVDADRLAVQQALNEVLNPTHTGRGAPFSRASISRQQAAAATPVADPGDGPIQPASGLEAGAARYKPSWSNEDNAHIELDSVPDSQQASRLESQSNTPIYIAKLAYDEPDYEVPESDDDIDLSAAAAASDPLADRNWAQWDDWADANPLNAPGEYGALNGLGAYGYGMAAAPSEYGEAQIMSAEPAAVMATISMVSTWFRACCR
jgi:hypothetical protein